jgi:cation transporter-like permease
MTDFRRMPRPGIREYIVSPLLIQTMSSSSPTYAYRLATLHHLEEADEFDRLGMMRNNRLLDSAAAGGLAGGVLSSVASE